MSSMIGSAAVVDRIIALFKQNFNAEVDAVDASANAIAGAVVGESSFDTPTMPTANMQPFDDFKQAEPYRLCVREGGRTDAGPPVYADDQAGTGRPRVDLWHAFRITFIVMANSGQLAGKFQAYRICDRYSSAGRILLMTYPKLSVPAPLSYARLPGVLNTQVISDLRAAGTDEEDRFFVVRELGIQVRLTETRS